MSHAHRCEICGRDEHGNDRPEPPEDRPRWTIVREGDVVISWACDEHLAAVCFSLQRFERPDPTRLIVTVRPVDAFIEQLRVEQQGDRT